MKDYVNVLRDDVESASGDCDERVGCNNIMHARCSTLGCPITCLKLSQSI